MKRRAGEPDRKAVHRGFERHREIMERRNSSEGRESGFTLIELLIVIVVLGILAAIVVFSLTGVSGQSKQAACTSDAKSVEIAADAYQAKNDTFAPSVAALVPTYLHTAPGTTNGYAISIDAAGAVQVAVPAGGTAVDFNDTTGCPAIS
jgi:prepilin-type N-terminal cleavage/methylation domain-containing protein